jgi:hypothetical protein
VLSNNLQVLLDRQLALPEALRRLPRRHFDSKKRCELELIIVNLVAHQTTGVQSRFA